LNNGVLITADPYSKIIDEKDVNTVMLFGDAATATLITDRNPEFTLGQSMYGTIGKGAENLKNIDGILYMNGRKVFNFVATKALKQIVELLEREGLSKDDIDLYGLHQGSRYVVETIAKKMGIEEKVAFSMKYTGNTVSSSIPLILEKVLEDKNIQTILISGFGVGFSMGAMILNRTIGQKI
jgi:3-oxoacyl-[acyl-carrier-protein] synthase-3